MSGEDRVNKGAGAAFAFGASDVDYVEAVEVRRGVAEAGEVGAHFGEGVGIGADVGRAAGGDDGVRSLEGVEGVDCILGGLVGIVAGV